MDDLPSGTVTFLFTDIEGSTRFWEQQPETMEADLTRHDRVLRQSIELHHGQVFKTIGDAFCAAFPTAQDAVCAAAAAQRALLAQKLSFRVRIALHSGEARGREGDYFGPALNRVARLLAAGHGGQVLLSEATAQQVQTPLLSNIQLRPLGVHRLRDLAARESIFQLLSPGLPSDFPPLNTLDVAFRRGMRRAASLATMVVAVMAGLALVAVEQARRAERREREARQQQYAAQVNLAQQAWEVGNVARARALLQAQRPRPGQEDLRGFEWRYLWRLCQADAPSTLRGHTDIVRTVAFSPDGRALASAGADNIVRLWDLASRRVVATLRGHTDNIWSVAFAPDGKTLASGGVDQQVRLWNVAARAQIAILKGHVGFIGSLAFSPDGSTLATGSTDRTVRIWDLATRRAVAILRGQANGVRSVAFSPDGRTLAAGNTDAVVVLWDVSTRHVVGTLRGHTAEVGSVAFSPDGRLLATGSMDGTARVWNLAASARPGARGAAGRAVATFTGHMDEVRTLAFAPDGKTLVTGSGDHTLKLWDLVTRREVTTFRGHQGGIYTVAFSPDGRTLASGSEDQTVKLWDPAAMSDTDPVLHNQAGIWCLALSPGGATLATGDDEDTVKLWQTATGRVTAILPGHLARIFAVAFSPDGKMVASGSDDHNVKLWDLDGRPPAQAHGMRKSPVATFPAGMGRVRGVAFSSDSKTLVAGGQHGILKLWDVASRREIATRKDAQTIFALAFSPDGRLLATGSLDHTIKLWDIRTWRLTATLTGHPNHIHYLAFSPTGTLVAGGGDGPTVRLWNVTTAKPVESFQAPGSVFAAAFAPDGRTLAVASARTITLFNLATGQEVATLRGHQAVVNAVAFDPAGNFLLSGSTDRTIRLWRAGALPEAGAHPIAPRRESPH